MPGDPRNHHPASGGASFRAQAASLVLLMLARELVTIIASRAYMPQGATFLDKLMVIPNLSLGGVESWKLAFAVGVRLLMTGAGTQREIALPVVKELYEQMSRDNARLPHDGGMRRTCLTPVSVFSSASGARWGSRPVSGRCSWAPSGPSIAITSPGCFADCCYWRGRSATRPSLRQGSCRWCLCLSAGCCTSCSARRQCAASSSRRSSRCSSRRHHRAGGDAVPAAARDTASTALSSLLPSHRQQCGGLGTNEGAKCVSMS
jgi:hypothetical protein